MQVCIVRLKYNSDKNSPDVIGGGQSPDSAKGVAQEHYESPDGFKKLHQLDRFVPGKLEWSDLRDGFAAAPTWTGATEVSWDRSGCTNISAGLMLNLFTANKLPVSP